MKPYRIIKVSRPQRKIKLIGKLIPKRVPLWFVKNIQPPIRVEFQFTKE